ncbi:MAG TPA: hypothetical protein ENH05_02090 [Rhizobiales bacterium]|nr:hypothetical protein BMS3Bbin10_00672 [bacterium BMS3Bbin10]HDO51507.1 hypothetical protein [Hyphomicrobiales bacterium]
MTRSRTIIYCAAILTALFAGSGAGNAAESQDAKPAAEEPVQCQKKLGVKGRPHRISTVATLTAVRAWVQVASKYGKEYTIWNEAENGTIKCEKLERSDYYMCFASGKPCRATTVSAADPKKSG